MDSYEVFRVGGMLANAQRALAAGHIDNAFKIVNQCMDFIWCENCADVPLPLVGFYNSLARLTVCPRLYQRRNSQGHYWSTIKPKLKKS